MKKCPTCKGVPYETIAPLDEWAVAPCPGCGGRGKIDTIDPYLRIKLLSEGIILDHEFVTCGICNGTGLINLPPKCPTCQGMGWVLERPSSFR